MTAVTHTNVTFQTEDKEIYKAAIGVESTRVQQLAAVLEECGVNSVTSYFDNFPAAEYVPDAEWNTKMKSEFLEEHRALYTAKIGDLPKDEVGFVLLYGHAAHTTFKFSSLMRGAQVLLDEAKVKFMKTVSEERLASVSFGSGTPSGVYSAVGPGGPHMSAILPVSLSTAGVEALIATLKADMALHTHG